MVVSRIHLSIWPCSLPTERDSWSVFECQGKWSDPYFIFGWSWVT